MATEPTKSPYYRPALEAVQKLANDTGIPWILQTVPLPYSPDTLAGELPLDADQPCLFCGQVH